MSFFRAVTLFAFFVVLSALLDCASMQSTKNNSEKGKGRGKTIKLLTSVAETCLLAAAETIVESSSPADETFALAAPGTATVPVLGSRLISSFLLLFLCMLPVMAAEAALELQAGPAEPEEEEEEEEEGEEEEGSKSVSSSQ